MLYFLSIILLTVGLVLMVRSWVEYDFAKKRFGETFAILSNRYPRKTRMVFLVSVILSVCLLISGVGLLFGELAGNFNSVDSDYSYNYNSPKCRNCGRNEPLVAGFDFCDDCFEGFTDWQKDNYR